MKERKKCQNAFLCVCGARARERDSYFKFY